ncbi:SseB family protein [Ostreiculturibacter nitratireducens]|uniref:SseB family protein n=1 Tax=Ostreiculturibacter nitratireducens TaxID=3075226 RepID=UPI0031B59DDD
MPETTVLDFAHAAMEAAPEDAAARLRFYERLADAELFLLLEAEPDGDTVSPQVFALEEGSFVMAFDREERLSAFTGAPAPYVALPGRVIAGLLAGEALGLGLNLAVAPSSFLMPPDAVSWLVETLGQAPEQAEARPEAFHAPGDLPQSLLYSLDTKLALAAGLGEAALLAGVTYAGGRRGHMLAFLGARPEAEAALAKAVSEALAFSGIEAGEIDVAFLAADDPSAVRMARVGLRFDLPEVTEDEQVLSPAAPGMDPKRPPKLR